ncbi:MAG: sulfatase-like hydrolase/transferase [Chloroflexi bacterium]|nr:sulfatase-like hydrolase/transferase [Chloroflexota bacterium]
MPKPLNFLWVSFEDTNPFHGCYGDQIARTPVLDRLAAEGCLWTHCFSTAGVCAPARSAVITGMYPTSIGTHHMRTTHTHPQAPGLPTPYSAVIPHYVKCFSEYLRAAGYYCTNNHKTDYQFDPPLTAWDELGPQAHWRNRPDPDQPFFAVFNPIRTHESGMWEANCSEIRLDPGQMVVPPYLPDTPAVRLAMARMYTHIEESDSELGRILQALDEDGLAENTVVFHWSDHGPLPRGKRWPYDAGIHVPLIVRGAPGVTAGTRSDQLVSTVDLAPTMLSLAGLPIPAYMQGQAFLGDHAAPPREYVYASRDRHDETYDMVRAVRDRRWKYIRHYNHLQPPTQWIPYLNRHPIMREMWRLHLQGKLEGPQRLLFADERAPEELYDTLSNPHELHNLACDAAYQPELARLRSALDEWRHVTGDLGDLDEYQLVRRWYPDGTQPATQAPIAVLYSEEQPGVEPAPAEASVDLPARIQLHCSTQGASIAYTWEAGDSPRWLLYHSPLAVPVGASTLRACAIRIGFTASSERSWRLQSNRSIQPYHINEEA